MSDLNTRLKTVIKEVNDFPKTGISFKDITPLLLEPTLFDEIVDALALPFLSENIDFVTGIESRGFLYGPSLARKLNAGFIPMRKEGKLPRKTCRHAYKLEYGEACIEAHAEDIPGQCNILIHDDLLATGGTAKAASELLRQLDARISGYSFIVELDFLQARKQLASNNQPHVHSLVKY